MLLTNYNTAKAANPSPTAADQGSAERPVRVAVIGCGAISTLFHLPVLAGHDGVKITALVDRDRARAEASARAYGIATVLTDAADLTRDLADAAIVATPPAHHAPCCRELAGRGLHLLVEKPMAVQSADAEAMVAAARSAGVVLSAGYFRRLFPAVDLLRSAMEREVFGRPIGFDVEEGGEYGWELASLGNLRRTEGGGGVLIDIGSHVIDLLLTLFPGHAELLEYRDDSLGGVETECVARFGLHRDRDDSPIEGRVALSRNRRLRNTLRIDFERGSLELRVGERDKLAVWPLGLELDDPTTGVARPCRIEAAWADQPERQGYAAYRAVIDDWLSAICGKRPSRLDATTALPTIRLIESCYQSRESLAWVWENPKGSANENFPAAPEGPPGRSPRVLLTGASGYIGTRAAERLLEEGWDVRAVVHRPGKAARLARLPVEMVLGDLTRTESLPALLHGCEAVVHAAVGTNYGSPRDIFHVTVGGTRNLAEVARAEGVRRFIHLSTLAVHGKRVTGTVDESTPVDPERDSDYGRSKAEAEKAVTRATGHGLPAVTLRIANVYGPFNSTLIARPLSRLVQGGLAVVGGDRRSSNTVHVDDVVAAILGALGSESGGVIGETFVVGSFDSMTWAEFYDTFAEGLGVGRIRTPEASENAHATRTSWWPSRWAKETLAIAKSPEFRGLARRVLESDPIGRGPRSLLEAFPKFDERLRKLAGVDLAHVYRLERDGGSADSGTMTMRPPDFLASSAKAERRIGYRPTLPREEAMAATLDWFCWSTRRTRSLPVAAPALS